MSSASHKRQVLSMYHQLLRSALSFPSIKKKQLYASIQTEFHRNRNELNANRIAEQVAVAKDGLQKLRMYTPMKAAASQNAWTLDLAQGSGIAHSLQ
ncbi:mitochondrial Complex1_LYR family protein [Andalucia godoyi]|uniref:Mitochondrial Complex1_LYR family protein n=1 Tax=Andalucia godoyi TaxID=505711 RepID=A0A8K0F2I5_ANDGO|nr:mitochondrial Complex1_LYR family protein [Andalucia godoyi]|eukprot:ANDGO_02047.mRNA.1 mitochondrial Complex1_LYR family protein